MFKFSKPDRNYPPFESLHAFADKGKYFVRTATWRPFGKDHISVIDPKGPRIFTLDPWPELIFMSADGFLTIEQYIYSVADKYSTEIPKELDKVVLAEIQTLLNYNLIRLTEKKGRPDPLFDKPINV